MDWKRELARRAGPVPDARSLKNALREFLHRAGESTDGGSVTPFHYQATIASHAPVSDVTLRVLIVRYNKIVRFVDPELIIEWPEGDIAGPVPLRLDAPIFESRNPGESVDWTPKRIRRAIDCVTRALILQRSVDVERKQ